MTESNLSGGVLLEIDFDIPSVVEGCSSVGVSEDWEDAMCSEEVEFFLRISPNSPFMRGTPGIGVPLPKGTERPGMAVFFLSRSVEECVRLDFDAGLCRGGGGFGDRSMSSIVPCPKVL
jgi:hypothetical protein